MKELTTKSDFAMTYALKKKWYNFSKCALFGGSGRPPQTIFVFLLSGLDFLQFQHDFRPFSDKKGHFTGGGGVGRSLASPVYMLKKSCQAL